MGRVGGRQTVIGWWHPYAATPGVDVCRDVPVAARVTPAEAHLVRTAEDSALPKDPWHKRGSCGINSVIYGHIYVKKSCLCCSRSEQC